MKKIFLVCISLLGLFCGRAQKTAKVAAPEEKTLLWRISGAGLTKPSYLFGTMHMICANDIGLSDSLKKAISKADKVYLELNLDNMFEMMGAMMKMNMKGDTTLSDLLTQSEYKKVKAYFTERSAMLPFSMMEKYKPMLLQSMVMEAGGNCDHMIVMENLVMQEAKKWSKKIDGLETMSYQLSIFDSIPYKLQAKQLVEMVDSDGKGDSGKELSELTDAYRKQDLSKMGEMTTKDDPVIAAFTDLLLNNRNRAWVQKLTGIMPGKSVIIAVGAGHLPGDKGIIKLLRKAGYKVEPVANDMTKKGEEAEI